MRQDAGRDGFCMALWGLAGLGGLGPEMLLHDVTVYDGVKHD